MPPDVALRGRWDGDAVRVCLVGSEEPLAIRWQSDGTIEGEGREVLWRPAPGSERLEVAVRGEAGVAIAALSLSAVTEA